MKQKISYEKQKNNYIKNNVILKIYEEENFKKCIVIPEKEFLRYLEDNIRLSDNIQLSKIFISDLVKLQSEIYI